MTVSIEEKEQVISSSTHKEHSAYCVYPKLSTSVYRRVAEYCDFKTRRKLAQVSQSWRALVTPLIWETVYIYDYPDCSEAASIIHRQYGRFVKNITFQMRCGRHEIPPWLDSPAEVTIIGSWLEVEWPSLETLSLRFLHTPVDIRIIDLATNMPLLRVLSVENSYLPWRDVAKWALRAPFVNDLSVSYASNLAECDRRRFTHLLGDYNILQGIKGDGFIRLRMQYQPDELGVFYASILRTQPILRELRIDRIPAAHVELLSKQLCFPSALETLCLGIESCEMLPPLSCLNPRALPNLSRLMVRCSPNPLSRCDNVLDEFIRHEWPNMKGLITSVLTNSQCQQLTTACPRLKVLMIQPESPTERQIHNTGLEAILRRLRCLRRLHIIQQLSPVGEMLSDSFIWKATRYDPPRTFSLRKGRRWETWAPKLASSPWGCASLNELSLCGVYISFPALIQLLSTLPSLISLKVCIRSSGVGTMITEQMFEPWGRHSHLCNLVVDDIHDSDIPHLRNLCRFMTTIKHCRISTQKSVAVFRNPSELDLKKKLEI